MTNLIAFIFILSSFLAYSQEEMDTITTQPEEHTVTYDSVDLYVINKTNRLIQLNSTETSPAYSIFYRDLKVIKEIRELRFDDADELIHFFESSQKALDVDKTIVGRNYTVSRNRLSKNMLRIDRNEGYFMLSRQTFDQMKAAFERTLD